MSVKLVAGDAFPTLVVPDASGQRRDISKPVTQADWMMVVVYRGQHCPLCTRYLNEIESMAKELAGIGVELAAVSGDSVEQLAQHQEKLQVSFPIYHSLSIEQMKTLGLYISDPRSPQETDHPFPEPALFVINEKGQLHVADFSNNPFVRPELKTLVSGLAWIRNPENNYPIRGMRSYEA